MNTSKINYDFLCGSGFDVHPLKSTDRADGIMLCGVQIHCGYEVIAHSDGDVALHALVDALLGAIGEGDIGEHFPPTDPKWKKANSTQFVQHALTLCQEKNAALVNVDITIICEHPNISPHKSAMRKHLSTILSLPENRINMKATTTEKLGFLGRSEGIAAQAVVSVKIPT
jgi:2-C-methyl-D-erythritol 4-phosphate cytidylyltransferase/2-C-methyl-D-erythritol 2,4-cyclodiphosphate synthase